MFDRPRNNVNVNFNRNYNVNDNVKTQREKNVEMQAENVMRKLGADDSSKPWYWKICWHLSEAQINNNLEQALKGNSPQRYFSWLCKRDMA